MGDLGTRTGDQTPFGVRKQEESLQIGRLDAIQKEVHESGSDKENLSANCIDRLFSRVQFRYKYSCEATASEYLRETKCKFNPRELSK